MRSAALALLLATGPVAAEEGFALDLSYAEALRLARDGTVVSALAVGERGYVPTYYLCAADGGLYVPLDAPLMRADEIEQGIPGLRLTREAGGTATLTTANMVGGDLFNLMVAPTCATVIDGWGFGTGTLRVLSVNDTTSASALAATIEAPE